MFGLAMNRSSCELHGLTSWDNLIIPLDYMIILLLQVIENKEAPKLQEELVCEILQSTF